VTPPRNPDTPSPDTPHEVPVPRPVVPEDEAYLRLSHDERDVEMLRLFRAAEARRARDFEAFRNGQLDLAHDLNAAKVANLHSNEALAEQVDGLTKTVSTLTRHLSENVRGDAETTAQLRAFKDEALERFTNHSARVRGVETWQARFAAWARDRFPSKDRRLIANVSIGTTIAAAAYELVKWIARGGVVDVINALHS
jgi:hypothetical protein